MTALAAQSPVGAKNLLFNPSLAGGSSLDPSPHLRGAFVGLDLGHTQADVIRATLEGIEQAHQIQSVLHPEPANVQTYRRLLPVFRQIRADLGRIGQTLAALPCEG